MKNEKKGRKKMQGREPDEQSQINFRMRLKKATSCILI